MVGSRAGATRWDHNIAYHDKLIRAIPKESRRALDIGCGDGVFARRLAERFARVDAIDVSPAMIETARRLGEGITNVHYTVADFMTADLPSGAYDYISAVAVLHHLPLCDALVKARTLLRPGGRLAILGLYRPSSVTDLAIGAVAVPVNEALLLWHGRAPNPAPTLNPSVALREISETVRLVLPGARLNRRLLWRYLVLWRSPGLAVP
jgi:SAM-dependent methyltransferase